MNKSIRQRFDTIINEINEELIDCLKKNPNIESICWLQFRPYFNDGDECRLLIFDWYMILKEDFKFTDERIQREYEDYTQEAPYEGWWPYNGAYECITDMDSFNRLLEIKKQLNNDKGLCEFLYDNHSHVHITANGIDITDHSNHD